MNDKKNAFTLVEVLITLVIVGVISVILLGSIREIKDIQYRNAYKKAYADINQAIRIPIANGEFTRNNDCWNERYTVEELNILKNYLKFIKSCGKNDLFSCWAKGDTVCSGACLHSWYTGTLGQPEAEPTYSFIDSAGRSWALFARTGNIYFVDTNGFARPNRFGKDRFVLKFGNAKNQPTCNASEYQNMVPYTGDVTRNNNSWCKHPPCYYKSWLK